MSRSRKKTPVACWASCKSQKRSKQVCNRKMRRIGKQTIANGQFENLPLRTKGVMDTWDMEGDGKVYHHPQIAEKWYIKLMRK